MPAKRCERCSCRRAARRAGSFPIEAPRSRCSPRPGRPSVHGMSTAVGCAPVSGAAGRTGTHGRCWRRCWETRSTRSIRSSCASTRILRGSRCGPRWSCIRWRPASGRGCRRSSSAKACTRATASLTHAAAARPGVAGRVSLRGATRSASRRVAAHRRISLDAARYAPGTSALARAPATARATCLHPLPGARNFHCPRLIVELRLAAAAQPTSRRPVCRRQAEQTPCGEGKKAQPAPPSRARPLIACAPEPQRLEAPFGRELQEAPEEEQVEQPSQRPMTVLVVVDRLEPGAPWAHLVEPDAAPVANDRLPIPGVELERRMTQRRRVQVPADPLHFDAKRDGSSIVHQVVAAVVLLGQILDASETDVPCYVEHRVLAPPPDQLDGSGNQRLDHDLSLAPAQATLGVVACARRNRSQPARSCRKKPNAPMPIPVM